MSGIKSRFTQVPNNLILAKMKPSTLKVILYLLMWQKAESIFTGVDRIARDCGIGQASVKRGIKELKKEGFITVIPAGKDHRSNTYIINFDKIDGNCILSKEENYLNQKRIEVKDIQQKITKCEQKIKTIVVHNQKQFDSEISV